MSTTQQQHPWRAAVRTAVEVAIVLVTAAIAAGPYIGEFVEQFWPGSPVVAWIAAAVVFLSALSGLLAKLAALPAVDAALQRVLNIGSSPSVDGGPR